MNGKGALGTLWDGGMRQRHPGLQLSQHSASRTRLIVGPVWTLVVLKRLPRKTTDGDVSLYTLMQELKKKKKKLNCFSGTSLAVHWLRLCAPNAGGVSSVPGGGTKIPDAANHSLKK